MYVLNKRTSLLCQAGSSLIIEHTWVSLFLYIRKVLSKYIKNAPLRMRTAIVAEQIQKKKEKRRNMALFIELLLMGVGLAMDAFAVSVCKGLGMKKLNKKQAVVIGLYFGGFQALMPLVGWILGIQFQKYITSIDHWIAFILLGFIGGKMILEAVKEWNEEDIVEVKDQPLDHRNMFVLAVATSIDALAVGITFAFLDTPILEAITIIGITTMIISIVGVVIGNYFGGKYKHKAELVGGILLVLLGVRILIQHLSGLA